MDWLHRELHAKMITNMNIPINLPIFAFISFFKFSLHFPLQISSLHYIFSPNIFPHFPGKNCYEWQPCDLTFISFLFPLNFSTMHKMIRQDKESGSGRAEKKKCRKIQSEVKRNSGLVSMNDVRNFYILMQNTAKKSTIEIFIYLNVSFSLRVIYTWLINWNTVPVHLSIAWGGVTSNIHTCLHIALPTPVDYSPTFTKLTVYSARAHIVVSLIWFQICREVGMWILTDKCYITNILKKLLTGWSWCQFIAQVVHCSLCFDTLVVNVIVHCMRHCINCIHWRH